VSRFIKCHHGWVNLAHVAKVAQTDTNMFSLYGLDGGVLGVTETYEEWVEQTAPVVTAACDAFAYVVSRDNSSHDRPEDGDFRVDKVPIVAWRIVGADPEPILMDSAVSNQTVLLPMLDGKVLRPFEATYNSLEDATAVLLQEARAEWDAEEAMNR
jgi:hypothetical protein